MDVPQHTQMRANKSPGGITAASVCLALGSYQQLHVTNGPILADANMVIVVHPFQPHARTTVAKCKRLLMRGVVKLVVTRPLFWFLKRVVCITSLESCQMSSVTAE